MMYVADVYSYPEDDMVVDPLLADHLAHFGIDIMSMKKVNVKFLHTVHDSASRCGAINAFCLHLLSRSL